MMNQAVFSNDDQASLSQQQEYADDDDNAGSGPAEMEPSLVCTCVIEDGPRICFATYDGNTNKIIIELHKVKGSETPDVVERHMSLVRPNLLLLHNRIITMEELLKVLTKPLPQPIDHDVEQQNDSEPNDSNDNNENDDDDRDQRNQNVAAPITTSVSSSIPYRTLKSGAFDRRRCTDLILQKLRVLSLIKQNQATVYPMAPPQGGMIRNFAPHAQMNPRFGVGSYHSLSALIDFDSPLEVQAVGALLSFLQTTEFRFEDGGTVTVADVVHSQSTALMSINASTLAALQIFSTEYHPLVAARGRGNSKEGSSLFTLLDRTRSSGGRQKLRDWMLKPLRDSNLIMQRQDGVEIFMLENVTTQLGGILTLMKEIGPIDKIMARIQKCVSQPKDFLSLNRTMTAAIGVYTILMNDVKAPLEESIAMYSPQARQNLKPYRYIAFLEDILQRCNVQVLKQVEDLICDIVDEESTNQAQSVCVREGYDQELDNCKEQYKNLQGKEWMD